MISAWLTLLLALPVLMGGEWLVRKVRFLSRFNIPAAVAAGLAVSLLILLANVSGVFDGGFETKVRSQWWTWLVLIEPQWVKAPAVNVNTPFLVAFFTCIGLNASWVLVQKGSMQVFIFLLVATGLAVVQNVAGVAIAKAFGAEPLLGLVCGSTTLTGGHGTALGFAPDFAKAGLEGAATKGMAAATFGLVAGGLLGGTIGGFLIRKYALRPSADPYTHLEVGATGQAGILTDLRAYWGFRKQAFTHFLLVAGCIKLGAWVSYFIQSNGITFPVYIGAMLLGVLIRNTLDLLGLRWIKTEVVDTLGSVMLGAFLTTALMSLNLRELAGTVSVMLIILSVQVGIAAVYALVITFRTMGKDYDAAVLAAGHCGFALGSTANAIACMKALAEKHGPSPRAFLVVPLVGSFLIDLVNASNITIFLNWLTRT